MGRKEKPVFHEEQRFRQPRQLFMLGMPPVGLLLLTIWQVALGHKWGNQPLTNGSLIGWTIFLWLLFWRLATVKLVTNVYRDRIEVAMRGLWRVRKIQRTLVQSARDVTFHPVRDYGGYGIRSTRNGKAYIAYGTAGVKLELADGATVTIGSQRASELAKALQLRAA